MKETFKSVFFKINIRKNNVSVKFPIFINFYSSMFLSKFSYNSNDLKNFVILLFYFPPKNFPTIPIISSIIFPSLLASNKLVTNPIIPDAFSFPPRLPASIDVSAFNP